MTSEERKACLALLSAEWGDADVSLLESTVRKIESAELPTTEGWASHLPYPVVQAWDDLGIVGKMVAYVIAQDRDNYHGE